MKITVVAVGKLKEKYLKDGIAEYEKRLSRYCELEIIEVLDEQVPENLSLAQGIQAKKSEAERILKKVKPGSIMIILDIKGEKMDSLGLARKLESFFVSGNSHLTFIIGGSIGLDEQLKQAAHLKLSFSDLTFPHQLTRLILLEQLYRSFKIIQGETYHK